MNIEQEQLVKLRKVQLEILDEFVRICEENNLVYFMTAGTLLGAVRHGGFIPWDDDIDVGMPRNDYEKFLRIILKNKDGKYINENKYFIVGSRQLDNFYHYYGYSKFCRQKTKFAKNYLKHNDYPGIFIDIWPFDNCIPSLAPLQEKLINIVWKLYRLATKYDIPIKKIKRFLAKIYCSIVPINSIKFLLNKPYKLFNGFRTKYVTNFPSRYTYKKEMQKYKAIFPLNKITFEGKSYYAPGDYDAFLTNLYGNYMEPPPVTERNFLNFDFVSFED